MKTETNRIESIDALRGFAAICVLAIHAIGESRDIYPKFIEYLIQNGGLGVQLFFVISGFSMFLTLGRNPTLDNKNIFSFYLRRIFRIMPLFLCVLIFSFILKNYILNLSEISIGNFLAHLFIIDSFNPYWMSNGIIGVEWTISVEMIFYFFVPVFFKYIKNKKDSIIVFISSIIISSIYVKVMLGLNPTPNSELWKYFLYKNLMFQLPVFLSGFILYYTIFPKKEIRSKKLNRLILPIISLTILFPYLLTFNKYALVSILFVLVCYFFYKYPIKLFVNKYTSYLGKISFSVYLLHLYAIQVSTAIIKYYGILDNTLFYYNIHLILSIIIVILMASITYKFVEEPGIKLGKYLVKIYGKRS